MNFAIIGADNVESGLAHIFAASAHGVVVAGSTEPQAKALAKKLIGEKGVTLQAADVTRLMPVARVTKGFDTVVAQGYESGLKFGDNAFPVFRASNDDAAKSDVMRIATAACFDTVDAGPLRNAREIETLGSLNIQFGYMLGLGTQITPAWLSR